MKRYITPKESEKNFFDNFEEIKILKIEGVSRREILEKFDIGWMVYERLCEENGLGRTKHSGIISEENWIEYKDEIIRLRKEGKGYSFLQKKFRVGYKILSEKFKKLGLDGRVDIIINNERQLKLLRDKKNYLIKSVKNRVNKNKICKELSVSRKNLNKVLDEIGLLPKRKKSQLGTSRIQYEKNKENIISDIKNGELLRVVGEKYNISPSSLSFYVRKDKSNDINQIKSKEHIYSKRFIDDKDEILKELEDGNSMLSVIKKYNLRYSTLKKELEKLGLFKKYSSRNWNKNYVNFTKNKDEIINLRRSGESIKDISKKFDIKRQPLKNELIKIGEFEIDFKLRKMYQTDDVKRFNKYKEEIFREFEKGKSIKSLGRKYRVNWSIISNRLIEEGMYVREERFVHQFNESFFSKIDSPKKSYWLGWMYSDGFVQIHSITKGKYIGLDLDEKDKSVVEGFRDDLDSNMKVRQITHKSKVWNDGVLRRGHYSRRLIFQSEKMFNDLGKKGVVPRKSLILKFPTSKQVPKKFINSFLLGYFEGDGSIILFKRKNSTIFRIVFTIIGTKELCEGYKTELEKILKNYSIESTVSIRKEKRSKSNTYNLYVTKTSSILVILSEILFSHESKMTRKSIKFLKYCKWYYENNIIKNNPHSHLKDKDICDEIVMKHEEKWKKIGQ